MISFRLISPASAPETDMATITVRAGRMPPYTAAVSLWPKARSSYPQRVCQT